MREIPSLVYDPYCALYLPLWKRDSSSFISDDAYGHLATVTGAIWTPRGRDFDGAGDFISVPDNDAWDSADFTLLVWAKQDAFAGDYWQRAFIAHDTIGGANDKWLFYHDSGTAKTGFDLRAAPYLPAAFLSDAWTLSAGVWYCIGLTKVGTALTFYKDGVANGTGSMTSNMINIAQPLTIGYAEGTPKTFDGIIGEALKYTRGLSAGEVLNYCLETKWRYV